MDIDKRIRMAAESILENEAIREGLDDSGASALLDWGTFCAIRITQDTRHLEDDEEAQEAVRPRMRALRQMLNIVKDLCKSEPTTQESDPVLEQLMETATLVYGENAHLPKRIYWNMLTSIRSEDTGQYISALRAMLEKNNQIQE